MTARTLFYGYPVYFDPAAYCWRFSDNDDPTAETWRDRPCGHCGLYPTPEGHDACLGTLPGVRNACCGHGDPGTAYVQFEDGTVVRGFDRVEQ